MVYGGWYNFSIHGIYKQTNISGGAPPCRVCLLIIVGFTELLTTQWDWPATYLSRSDLIVCGVPARHGGYPMGWRVFVGENPMNVEDSHGATPIDGNTHISHKLYMIAKELWIN